MDPNANLAEQEDILRCLSDSAGDAQEHVKQTGRTRTEDVQRLYELRDALNGWLDGGGFAPDWSEGPNARKYYGK